MTMMMAAGRERGASLNIIFRQQWILKSSLKYEMDSREEMRHAEVFEKTFSTFQQNEQHGDYMQMFNFTRISWNTSEKLSEI